MANKSRRLPGGKVRKPVHGPRRTEARPAPAAQGAQGAVAAPATPPDLPAGEGESDLAAGVAPSPVSGGAGRRAGQLDGGRGSGGASRLVGRGAVTARTLAGRGVARTGPSSLDAAAAGLSYIRSDLVRIAILAVAMVAVIVVLSFVIK